MSAWPEHLVREEERYREGEARLPEAEDADARQRQLTRLGNAAGGAGLALLMLDRPEGASAWFALAAERYRESFADAPPGSWGRLIGAVKACLLGNDWPGAERDARWALDQQPGEAESPIGRYAGCLALLVLGDDGTAGPLAASITGREDFPQDVADALSALGAGDARSYTRAVTSVLESFETRGEYLEDIPVADTVLVLQALAERRGMRVELESALLPAR